MTLYQEMIGFIVEMHNQNIHIRVAEPIADEIKYEFTVSKIRGHYTQTQVRRLIKLKAFW